MLRHRKSHDEKRFPCPSCPKTFDRKDNLHRHRIRCQNDCNQTTAKQSFACEHCDKTFARKFNLNRHLIHCLATKKTKEQKIQQRLKYFSDLHLETIELGKSIAKCLNENPDFIEESLPQEDKHALSLYQRSRSTIDVNTITLKPWQSKVLTFIDLPSDREVFWIVGKKGNEGKSFLQNYIRFFFGDRRVVTTDINGRKKDIAHYLTKLPLECKDIFLFNNPASTSEVIAYDLLEAIKDGGILSHKYNTNRLTFKTPNTVMVFSNNYPNQSALKKDRWRIYEIIEDELYDKTGKLTKLEHSFPGKYMF